MLKSQFKTLHSFPRSYFVDSELKFSFTSSILLLVVSVEHATSISLLNGANLSYFLLKATEVSLIISSTTLILSKLTGWCWNNKYFWFYSFWNLAFSKLQMIKGNPVHWSSRICRVREGVPPFGVLYAASPCFYTRDCFQDLNPWPYGRMTTTLPVAPRLPLKVTNDWLKFF